MFYRYKKFIAILALFSFTILSNPLFAYALDTSKTNFLNGSYLSNIINDGSFTDINSMSVSDIQNFLVQKNSTLATADPGTLGDGANGRSAAQIIYDAAQAGYGAATTNTPDHTWYGIKVDSTTGTVSPKVILTYLEKEQSLVSQPSANQNQLDCAMGYENGQGCQYMFQNYSDLKGFSNQVGNAAWQLRYDFEYAKRGIKPSPVPAQHFIVGETDSLSDQTFTNNYNVTMTNATTAAIYSYTPYVFDSAYNVWSIFNDWFTASPDVVVVSSNDTAPYSQATYSNQITVGGSKAADSNVYFNNQLIQGAGTQWQLTFTASQGANDYTINYEDSTGAVVATKPIHIDLHKTADINGDGKVDIQDLSILSSFWGQNKPANALTDLNGDGVVDILDLSLMAANWGG